MLSHDSADRTLPPTERHRRAARVRGDVARSSDLTIASQFLVFSFLMWFLASSSANQLASLMKRSLTLQPPTAIDISAGNAFVAHIFQMTAVIVAPIALTLIGSGLIANLAQTGWLWIPGAVLPRFRQSTILSSRRSIEAIGRILRLCMLSVVAYHYISIHAGQFRALATAEPLTLLSLLANMFGELCIQLSFCLIVFSLVDYGIRYWRHEQSLKMTAEERRSEQRDQEVDPRIKQAQVARTAQSPVDEAECVAGIVN